MMKIKKIDFIGIIDSLATMLRLIKIKARLIISFAVILFIPILLMSVYALSYSSSSIKSIVSTFSTQEMNQISQNINNGLQNYQNDILAVTTDPDFADTLAIFYELSDDKKKNFLDLINDSHFKSYLENKDISSVVISDGNGKIVAGRNYDANVADMVIKMKDIKMGNAVVKAINTSSDSKQSKYELAILRQIVGVTQSDGTGIGYIWMILDDNYFYNIYKNYIKENNIMLMVMDSNGIVVSSSNKDELGKVYKDKNLIKAATSSKLPTTLSVNNKNYLVSSQSIGQSGLRLVSMVSNSYINGETSQIKIIIFVIGIFIFAFAVILSTLISKSISVPLNRLMHAIEEAKEGKIKSTITNYPDDELGEVTESFNEMMVTLNNLIGETKDNSAIILKSIKSISEVSEQTFGSSEEISATMNEVAKGAGVQAEGMNISLNHLNNLSDAIEDVEFSLKETLKVVYDTEGLGEKTKTAISFLEEKSKETGFVVSEISQNINELNAYMNEIGATTKLIVGISQQTNLLSLNASIEAARAGDAGKGFIIVSEEVKKLADQTKNASSKIDNIISNLSNKIAFITENVTNARAVVEKQDNAIGETFASVSSIMQSMSDVIERINEIINSINEIYNLKGEAIYAIEGISSVSQQTAAITQEVTATTSEQMIDMENLSASSSTLNDMISKLNDAIGKFEV